MLHIRTKATVHDVDGASEFRVLTEFLKGFGNLTAARIGLFLSDCCDSAIDTDCEHFVRAVEVGIDSIVQHERAEPTEAGGDHGTVFRVFADFPRQREKL